MSVGCEENRETVGAIAQKLRKNPQKVDSVELQRAMFAGETSEDSFENQVRIAVERGKKEFDGTFYVVVLTKRERLLINVIRQIYVTRKSCPTSEYDQVVYKFFPKEERLELIWVVPDKQTVESLPLFKNEIKSEQSELFQFVLDFRSGKLDKLSDKLNEELNQNRDGSSYRVTKKEFNFGK